MGKRWVTCVLCLLLLLTAGCAVEAQSVDAPIEVLDFPAASTLPVRTPSASRLAAHPTPAPGMTLVPSPSTAAIPTQEPTAQSTVEPTAKPTAEPAAKNTPDYDLTKVNDEIGYVKGHDVNMRKGPGTKYDVVDEVGYLTIVVITGKTEEWYRIEIGDDTGFMLKEFVGVGAIPTSTPTPKPTAKATAKPTAKPTPEPEIEEGGEGNYSDSDIYLAAKLIYAEGRNQSDESFLAMASVLYNRCNSSKFGGSVEREVYRSGQFSVVSYSSFEGLEPSGSALAAAQSVFNDGDRTIPAGVMYFRSASAGEYWASSRKFYKKIGGNNYYY